MEEDSLIIENASIVSEISSSHSHCDRRKYAQALNKIRSLKDEVFGLKVSHTRMRNVLLREVGSEEALEEALLTKGSNWQGRAEVIKDLRIKVKEFSSHIQPSNVSIVVDHKREQELEKSVELLTASLAEAEKLRKALRSRNQVLEEKVSSTRTDIRLLLEKDKFNSELIAEMRLRLTYFLDVFRPYGNQTIHVF
jgi:hypothetical protein